MRQRKIKKTVMQRKKSRNCIEYSYEECMAQNAFLILCSTATSENDSESEGESPDIHTGLNKVCTS